jgi:hypothetical protein
MHSETEFGTLLRFDCQFIFPLEMGLRNPRYLWKLLHFRVSFVVDYDIYFHSKSVNKSLNHANEHNTPKRIMTLHTVLCRCGSSTRSSSELTDTPMLSNPSLSRPRLVVGLLRYILQQFCLFSTQLLYYCFTSATSTSRHI